VKGAEALPIQRAKRRNFVQDLKVVLMSFSEEITIHSHLRARFFSSTSVAETRSFKRRLPDVVDHSD